MSSDELRTMRNDCLCDDCGCVECHDACECESCACGAIHIRIPGAVVSDVLSNLERCECENEKAGE